ncbi:MAG: hypothetical protein V1773_16000 [bacterium]
MKNGQLFWGSFFIVLGLLIFGTNYNIFNFDWDFIGNLWPFILIFWGLLVVSKNTIFKPILSGLFGFFVAVLIFGSVSYLFDGFNYSFHEDFSNKNYTTNEFSSNFDESAVYGNLEIKTGAATVKLQDTTNVLVEGWSKGTFGDYYFNSKVEDSTAFIEFSSEGSHEFHFRDKIKNNLEIKLNPKLIWDFYIDIGASKTYFDLTAFKIRNIELNTGATSNLIKIGSKYESTNITVEMGAANLRIKIPKESGCLINGDLVLSSHNLKGFKKTNKHSFETENYDSAKNKVLIDIEGGVSKFTVERY